jgi:hypothetical protein
VVGSPCRAPWWAGRALEEERPLDLETLANLGEFVGGTFVVVSLVYLALQVRQNTRGLRTENYARALDRISALQSRLSQEAEFTALFSRGVLDVAALSPRERIQFTWALYEAFGSFEFMFHQARDGALPAEVWERWSATVAWWLSFAGTRAWWAARPAPFSASFAAYVDALIAADQVDHDAARRWQAFIAGAPQSGSSPA